jgi:hypothetical protein
MSDADRVPVDVHSSSRGAGSAADGNSKDGGASGGSGGGSGPTFWVVAQKGGGVSTPAGATSPCSRWAVVPDVGIVGVTPDGVKWLLYSRDCGGHLVAVGVGAAVAGS